MREYRVFKTTMGRKFKVRMSEDEIVERELFWIAVMALPFFTSILFAVIFFTRG